MGPGDTLICPGARPPGVERRDGRRRRRHIRGGIRCEDPPPGAAASAAAGTRTGTFQALRLDRCFPEVSITVQAADDRAG